MTEQENKHLEVINRICLMYNEGHALAEEVDQVCKDLNFEDTRGTGGSLRHLCVKMLGDYLKNNNVDLNVLVKEAGKLPDNVANFLRTEFSVQEAK